MASRKQRKPWTAVQKLDIIEEMEGGVNPSISESVSETYPRYHTVSETYPRYHSASETYPRYHTVSETYLIDR